MKNSIDMFLRELGMKATLYGFQYLSYGLQLVIEDETYLLNLTKRLYPDIAKDFGATACRVERSLRTLIDYFWENGNRPLLEELTGHSIKNKPYAGEFIDIILHGYLRASSTQAR